jgi:hypothetical protein
MPDRFGWDNHFGNNPAPMRPGDLYRWALYWQNLAASRAADAREWRDRDEFICAAYQDTARTYYGRARRCLFTYLSHKNMSPRAQELLTERADAGAYLDRYKRD